MSSGPMMRQSALALVMATVARAYASQVAPSVLFFVWLLHGSTKVVVRAVALLSAKTK